MNQLFRVNGHLVTPLLADLACSSVILDVVHGPLRPSEMALHRGRCFHASGANKSDDRRIGLAIRYVAPEVRDDASRRGHAMLVRGADAARGWLNVVQVLVSFLPRLILCFLTG